jgi:hypothetical protein
MLVIMSLAAASTFLGFMFMWLGVESLRRRTGLGLHITFNSKAPRQRKVRPEPYATTFTQSYRLPWRRLNRKHNHATTYKVIPSPQQRRARSVVSLNGR